MHRLDAIEQADKFAPSRCKLEIANLKLVIGKISNLKLVEFNSLNRFTESYLKTEMSVRNLAETGGASVKRLGNCKLEVSICLAILVKILSNRLHIG